MGSVVAVCRVHQLLPDSGSVGTTAIDKRAVGARVKARRLGLYADVQADRANHGGPDQAVYAYAEEDAEHWATELDRKITPGLFGENLRTSGLAVSTAVVGERWRVGSAVLEVTQPRTPCATFQRRMGEERWVRRFTAANRTGAYLRVTEAGEIGAGDTIDVVHVPEHGVRIADWFAAYYSAARGVTPREGEQGDPDPVVLADLARRLLAGDAAGDCRLSDEMRGRCAKAVAPTA
ncbi:MOSC domain-containing protein [Myceligenerans pegani]|uniref:MOSC domain-containing protein n=1 Tax=Myceligenerans pegani TaxID=2776917 RepID=A0ABR9N042_9MICO|nr:MOSC domain-containing protein [Myceligenerans sp. TRM 65318]MBE1877020.1 MOSC domain-containing protein [Myceligenerans sp. TRM 65318]MBE3019291.1 MOSC domain-containing protein [Myceligenerans sp. TRM 65318]